jgi:hypothetical protein
MPNPAGGIRSLLGSFFFITDLATGGLSAHAPRPRWSGRYIGSANGHFLWVEWLKYAPRRHLRRKNSLLGATGDSVFPSHGRVRITQIGGGRGGEEPQMHSLNTEVGSIVLSGSNPAAFNGNEKILAEALSFMQLPRDLSANQLPDGSRRDGSS